MKLDDLRARFARWDAARKAPKPKKVTRPKMPIQQRLERLRDLILAGEPRSFLVKFRGYPPWMVAKAEETFGIKVEQRRRGRPPGTRVYSVVEIRAAYDELKDCAAVGRKLGIDRRTVYRIAVQEAKQ